LNWPNVFDSLAPALRAPFARDLEPELRSPALYLCNFRSSPHIHNTRKLFKYGRVTQKPFETHIFVIMGPKHATFRGKGFETKTSAHQWVFRDPDRIE